MPKVISIREENKEEKKLREWFATQALESPNNLEEAAKLLVGLVTGLLGVLFGVLTVSAEKLPAYLSIPSIKGLGVIAVGFWLLSLLAGLFVITPLKWESNAGKPETQKRTFQELLKYKSAWLTASVILFGVAVIALAIVLIAALLSV